MPRLFGARRRPQRVLVIGLDCAAPELLFDRFRADLPTFSRLAANGTWGELQSSIPCITVPAWASMLTSRDPGVLGCYGFRNRDDHSYTKLSNASATAIQQPRVWDYLTEAGRESVVLAVPQTYPPRPLKGHLVTDFLTPGIESQFAYPAIFKQEVLRIAPNYPFDVRGFRTDDKAWLLQQIIDLTEQQYRLALHSLKSKPWDFFMHVNIGVDRIHHGFWRYFDLAHRLYQPGNRFENAIRDYYVMVDQFAAQMIEAAGDGTTVLVVSDHGAKRMDGGLCLNEWLWRNGWLALKTPPKEGEIRSFEAADVDWSKTRAWGAGGYYGRVFLNVAGREPQGVIPADQYEAVRDELASALAAIPDADGQPMPTRTFKPEQIYQQVNGVAPDLLVYFGGLHWRSVGGLGYDTVYTLDNDTGPDDANHAENGLFILCESNGRGRGCVEGQQLMDVAPTILARLGLRPPATMQGREIA